MNEVEILQAWRELLPPSVYVVGGPVLQCATPLTVREKTSAGALQAEREREFESGRTYAKHALSILGIDDTDLPVASDRSPLWPEGIVGSIAHWTDGTEGYVAAALAWRRDVCAIGIDVECDEALHPSMWCYLLSDRELERLLLVPPQLRASQAQAIWCAKEAVTKAAQRLIEPTAIDLEYHSSESGFVARLRGRDGKLQPAAWGGRTVRSQGLILAAVIQPARVQ